MKLLKKLLENLILKQKFDFKINDHVLFFNGERIILPASIDNFDFLKLFVQENNVLKILPFRDIFIILLSSTSSRDNVCAIDKTGKIIWRIDPVPYHGSPAYQWIRLNQEGSKLIALNGRGDFEVDPFTGKVGKLISGPT